MAKRTDIKRILVIGAGPIVIGQACEFDYSGTQACRALREEGYFVILINSNPATIMTDAIMADRTYIEPITTEFVEKIIIQEKPDAILPTVGGQTALNCALDLWHEGILDKYNVELIGAKPDSIDKAENRKSFNKTMTEIGLEVAKNMVVNNLADAIKALDIVKLPAIIRPSFTLGGSGGGVAHSMDEFIKIVEYGLSISPTHEVLIDESLLGWKEYEMEVVRDRHDNAIIICSIENIDPMGIHTGDSITVAPALTLTDKEYQWMRDASIAVLRAIGVETGGANVQFAINPKSGRMIVIEMNPRVSRSSALASKATGFPIAKIAAKLAIGYTLDELKNDITRYTPASFEPTIDYVVTKIPKFTFEKFSGEDTTLTTSMKSIGEVMAIGRSFAESLQKALRSMESGLYGLNSPLDDELNALTSLSYKQELLRKRLQRATPDRLLYIAEALRSNISSVEIQQITSFDPWFLEQLENIVKEEMLISKTTVLPDRKTLVRWKKMGFCDKRIAILSGINEEIIRAFRHEQDVRPVYKTIDTCAGEFTAYTPYLYSCYADDGFEKGECEADISMHNKVIILGSGPNRIGQGIEFDYACCHVASEMRHSGIETIMVNCNPETVSTDYDTSDKLYFEPLYYEDVIELIENEQTSGNLLGVLVQFGGQTPLKLAHYLAHAGIKILGTTLDSIDLAEDRGRFKDFLAELAILQPQNAICYNIDELPQLCHDIGFPLIIRPSNVLGGRAMMILRNETDLKKYLVNNKNHIMDGSILVDKFLASAIELDVDAICDGESVYIAGIMEQIERAGVHSGDSACILPGINLTDDIVRQIKHHTHDIALKLKVHGLLNIQYALQDNKIYVIEVNPRASRTVPFVAKATNIPLIKITVQVLLGSKLKDLNLPQTNDKYYAVKEVTFPFARFATSDLILGPEMKSTGEVMGIDVNPLIAYAKAQIAVHNFTHLGNDAQIMLLCDLAHINSAAFIKLLAKLEQKAFKCYFTSEIWNYLPQHNDKFTGINVAALMKRLKDKNIDYVITLSSSPDFYALRRAVILNRIPYSSTLESANIFIDASLIYRANQETIQINALQDA